MGRAPTACTDSGSRPGPKAILNSFLVTVGIDPVDALVLDSADTRAEMQAQHGERGEVDLRIGELENDTKLSGISNGIDLGGFAAPPVAGQLSPVGNLYRIAQHARRYDFSTRNAVVPKFFSLATLDRRLLYDYKRRYFACRAVVVRDRPDHRPDDG